MTKVQEILKKYEEIDQIWKEFPEDYYRGFTIDWKNKFEDLFDNSHRLDFYYRIACLIDCSNSLLKRTQDPNVSKAVELITQLGKELYIYKNSLPICIKFRPATYQESVIDLNKLKRLFFTDDAFGIYEKGCDNLAQPNVHETASIEFGKLVKGNWVRTNIEQSTHIGIYFDSSYLGERYIRKEGIEKIFQRNLSSHRHHHIFAFVIRKKEGEYKLKSTLFLQEILDKYKAL